MKVGIACIRYKKMPPRPMVNYFTERARERSIGGLIHWGKTISPTGYEEDKPSWKFKGCKLWKVKEKTKELPKVYPVCW